MRSTIVSAVLCAAGIALAAAPSADSQPRQRRNPAPATSAAVELWTRGKTAFGVFAPSEAERGQPAVYSTAGARALAGNRLYDFVFLNLEPRYDPAAIRALAAGLGAGSGARKTLIVRIPTPDRDGLEAVRSRITEAYALGADGVTVPHVRSADEARQVIGFFRGSGANIWTPDNKQLKVSGTIGSRDGYLRSGDSQLVRRGESSYGGLKAQVHSAVGAEQRSLRSDVYSTANSTTDHHGNRMLEANREQFVLVGVGDRLEVKFDGASHYEDRF